MTIPVSSIIGQIASCDRLASQAVVSGVFFVSMKKAHNGRGREVNLGSRLAGIRTASATLSRPLGASLILNG